VLADSLDSNLLAIQRAPENRREAAIRDQGLHMQIRRADNRDAAIIHHPLVHGVVHAAKMRGNTSMPQEDRQHGR
jgi:hypothetical protein